MVSDVLDRVVHKDLRVVLRQPLLSLVRHLLVETQFYSVTVSIIDVVKGDSVMFNLAEILNRFLLVRCPKPFIVLHIPLIEVDVSAPFLEIPDREERDLLMLACLLGCFNDGCDEFLKEAFHLE